jgi:hypothetical protein
MVQEVEDRIGEIEVLQKVLREGVGTLSYLISFLYKVLGRRLIEKNHLISIDDGMIFYMFLMLWVDSWFAEAYDTLTTDLVDAKERLQRILIAKDKRATVRATFPMFFFFY